MRRGSRSRIIGAALLLLALAPAAAAYHGEDGAAGLVVRGPVTVDGSGALRAVPGAAAFEGPGDAEFRVLQGVAEVRVVEVRERENVALQAAGKAVDVREEQFALPRPSVRLLERGLAFNALLYTGGGVTSFRLDAPAGYRVEPAGPRALAPSSAARADGLDRFAHATEAPGVVAFAQRGVVTAAGDFSIFLYDAVVRFESADAAFEERLGAWTEEDETGRVSVVRHAVVAFRRAQVDVPFTSGFAGFHAGTVDLEFDGTARLANARGRAVVGDRAATADGGGVLLAGVLTGSATPVRGDPSALRVEARGDVTAMTVGPESASFLREEHVAAASALVLALGALAWFWPTLKAGLVAPLYARINGSDVMDHAARDRAFAFVREHPGASVHDVASGLDVAWSTAAYHLRVLEREGFVAGERRGRHRRFFAVGAGPARDAVFATEHPTARRLLAAILAAPRSTQKDLAAAVGVTPSTASWHLERLEAAGFVASEREWRALRYAPGPRFGEVAGWLSGD